MRVAVTGASGVLGRGLVARMLSSGHDVVGLARHRPESWPSAAQFVHGDIRDAAVVGRAIAGAEVVAHCAWAASRRADDPRSREVNIGGTANVLAAMAKSGARRIVFVSSAHVYGTQRAGVAPAGEHDQLNPVSAVGRHQARAEEMLAASGAEWVAVRSALIIGRDVDNWVQRLLACPVFPDIDGSAGQRLQVVHPDDALRVLARAAVDGGIESGPLNLAAPGEPTFGEVVAALGRRVLPIHLDPASKLLRGCATAFFDMLSLVQNAPLMDTSRLRDQWAFTPAWNAGECVEDLALGLRGRVAVGQRVM